MVMGYECCRINGRSLEGCVDLIICDEGHKIKNRKIKTAEALVLVNAPKRIILTGTPIQNSLEEYFTLVDFINPGIFINYRKFKKVYTDCISEGQAVGANINQRYMAEQRMKSLNKCSQLFILRRTADLLMKMLPRRNEFIIFVKLNKLQKDLYRLFVESDVVQKVLNARDQIESHMILQLICLLRKIVNHPRLIYKYINKNDTGEDESEMDEELFLFEQKLNDEKIEKEKQKLAELKGEAEPMGPIVRKNKEQLAEEMRLKKALRAKNSKEVKKIWATESLTLFPKDFA